MQQFQDIVLMTLCGAAKSKNRMYSVSVFEQMPGMREMITMMPSAQLFVSPVCISGIFFQPCIFYSICNYSDAVCFANVLEY